MGRRRGLEPGFDAEPHWRAVEPDDLLTLIYTSGHDRAAEGRPARAPQPAGGGRRASRTIVQFPDGRDSVISWLPAAHIAERAAHHYLPIVYAMTITTCPNPREIVAYLPPVRPDLVLRRPADLGEAARRACDGVFAAASTRADRAGAGRGDAQGRARAGGRAGARRRSRPRSPSGRRGCSPAARDARPRRGRRGQRRRRADAARGARVLPRDRHPAGRAVGHVGDVRRRRCQPARPREDRHRRAAGAGRRAASWPRTARCSCAPTS